MNDDVANRQRLSTGIEALDRHLGGGLAPGTLTVVVGATGIGKTQLGVHMAAAGRRQEGQRGIFLDLSSRGDSQSYAQYAERLDDWHCRAASPMEPPFTRVFSEPETLGEHLALFGYVGRRVTRNQLDFQQWRQWQAALNNKLQSAIAFLYGNFLRGVRRVVVDGIEPTDRPDESAQLHLFEYVYHQVLRKDSEWVARDLLRENYRQNQALAAERAYDSESLSCMLLYTSKETMLDDLISRHLDEGDVLAHANTLIYMGKTREQSRMGRAMFIAKHRGSRCSDEILPFAIDERGLRLEDSTG